MIRRITFAVVASVLGAVVLHHGSLAAQSGAAEVPRGIRRDIPMTNAIRRAFDAGTRDASGRPGPNYWQLQTDYTIQRQPRSGDRDADRHRNDRAAQQQPAGPAADHDAARPQHLPRTRAARIVGAGGNHRRHGDHEAGRERRRRRSGGTGAGRRTPRRSGGHSRVSRRTTASGLDQTSALVTLGTPIAAKANGTIEIAWHTKLPGGPGQGHRMTQRWEDRLFQPTQWYPRVAVYDDLRGWDTNPYLGPSEFYNNFGRFDVKHRRARRLDRERHGRAAESAGGAHGEGARAAVARARVRRHHHDRGRRRSGTRARRRRPAIGSCGTYVADMVNDFAWATAQQVRLERHARDDSRQGRRFPSTCCSSPAHASQFANAGPIARHALEFYSKLWIAVSVPAAHAAGRPEQRHGIPDGDQLQPGRRRPRDRPSVVADDGQQQRNVVRLDGRGIQPVHEHPVGRRRAQGQAPNLNGRGQQLRQHERQRSRAADDVERELRGSAVLRFQTYQKTPLMLSMLGGIVGDANVQQRA